MIHTVRTVRTLQAVAMSVVVALLLWSTGLPTIFRFAEAASITNASDTLETSEPGVGSNHTIEFTTPSGLAIGEQITITFPIGVNEFVLGGLVENDVDIVVNGSSSSTANSAGAGVWGVSTTTSTVVFTTPTNMGVASGTPIEIRIGTNAVDFGTGATKIINPTAIASYGITIGGTMQDSGEVRVAIVDDVDVSASVNTSLTFTVNGVASGQTVNGSPTTTASGTAATTLPFGTLNSNGTTKILAHDLTVTTNATNGYTVTVEQEGNLASETGATIDGFIDGNYTQTPTAWTAPSAVISNTNTYGHWGLTSNDTSIPARSGQFGSDQWVSGSTTPIAISGHTGPVLATTTRVGYQIQISPLQEAASDYSTQLRYIVTPTF
jgi:hypothetical protein